MKELGFKIFYTKCRYRYFSKDKSNLFAHQNVLLKDCSPSF